MDQFDGTTLKHADWREADGRLYFTDQRIDTDPVSFLPFLEGSGRVGYVVDDRAGTTEILYLEPSPNRKAQKVMIVHEEDSEEEIVGQVDIDIDWTFRNGWEVPFGKDPVRLSAAVVDIASAYWPQVASSGEDEERINFDGLGVAAGDYRYVPFIDAAGKLGYQVLGPDRESTFLYLCAADSGEDLTITVNSGESLTVGDSLLAAYGMANWLEDKAVLQGGNPGRSRART